MFISVVQVGANMQVYDQGVLTDQSPLGLSPQCCPGITFLFLLHCLPLREQKAARSESALLLLMHASPDFFPLKTLCKLKAV